MHRISAWSRAFDGLQYAAAPTTKNNATANKSPMVAPTTNEAAILRQYTTGRGQCPVNGSLPQ